MKVLQSCEWIRTSFMLLSRCLSHRLPISSILTGREGAKDASQTTARGVKHLRATMWCEFLMKQRLRWFTPSIRSPWRCRRVFSLHRLLLCQCASKSPCCSQRWTMMYVLHFSFGWGHRLHKRPRQVWYFNLFLVRGCWALCPINTQGSSPAKISHGSVSLFCLWAETSTRIAPEAEIWVVCNQKYSFFCDRETSDNHEHRNLLSSDDKRADWHLKIPFFSPSNQVQSV